MNKKLQSVIYLSILLLILSFHTSTALASSLSCFNVDGMSIFGYKYDEYIYIGSIANEFSSDSIANDFGWGSEFKSNSIMNDFGKFGSEFSTNSAFNDFASKPPIIIDSNYRFVGYLTTNDFKSPSINTHEAISCAKKSFRLAIRNHEDTTFKNIPSRTNTYSETIEEYSCSLNSTLIGSTCVCNNGYISNGVSCITYTKNCQAEYGLNSYGNKDYCYCSLGYEWDTNKTTCNKKVSCPDKASRVEGICSCNSGYLMRNEKCISHTQDCINTFGSNVSGIKGDKDNSSCSCQLGYKWNNNQTSCIKDNLSTSSEVKSESDNNIAIPEGAIIRAENGIDIYIIKYVGTKKFKRLVLSPSVFNNYGHLKWEDVMDVTKSTLNSFTTSELVRAVGDNKIYRLYPQGDSGQKRLLKDNSVLTRLGLDPDSIYEINLFDRESYITGADLE